jgi:hypothetical protein
MKGDLPILKLRSYTTSWEIAYLPIHKLDPSFIVRGSPLKDSSPTWEAVERLIIDSLNLHEFYRCDRNGR